MTVPRASGILLHPTSLARPFGIGDLSDPAYAVADFLLASGQSLWQVRPLVPTGYGNLPYACYSASAGNTLLISPERLVAKGLLSKNDVAEASSVSPRIDFESVHKSKETVVRKAYQSYQRTTDMRIASAFETFAEQNDSVSGCVGLNIKDAELN